MSKWYDVYVERMNDSYRGHVRQRYAPFIDQILRQSRPNDVLTEVGCGAANITRIVAANQPKPHFNHHYHALDNCPKMRELAQMNLKPLVDQGVDAFTTLCDVTKEVFHWADMKPGLIHSHGLLEHFDDETIREMIRLQKETGAHTLIHYVPGFLYETPSFGCERLLCTEQWRDICRPDLIETFNGGFDYMLMWEQSYEPVR